MLGKVHGRATTKSEHGNSTQNPKLGHIKFAGHLFNFKRQALVGSCVLSGLELRDLCPERDVFVLEELGT